MHKHNNYIPAIYFNFVFFCCKHLILQKKCSVCNEFRILFTVFFNLQEANLTIQNGGLHWRNLSQNFDFEAHNNNASLN